MEKIKDNYVWDIVNPMFNKHRENIAYSYNYSWKSIAIRFYISSKENMNDIKNKWEEYIKTCSDPTLSVSLENWGSRLKPVYFLRIRKIIGKS